MVHRRIRWTACALLIGGLAWQLSAQEPARPGSARLLIVLMPRARLADPFVRLGDVAELQGGSVSLRAKTAALDLAELSAAQPELALTKEQVYFRLRLAGLEESQFRLSGATQSMVQWENTATPRAKVASKTPTPDPSFVIRQRDPVRLLARIGNVHVTARGEAQDEGRMGQVLRVRNIDSNKIVSGRVVDRNVVEVDY